MTAPAKIIGAAFLQIINMLNGLFQIYRTLRENS